jgi:hypothetical protein
MGLEKCNYAPGGESTFTVGERDRHRERETERERER